MTTKLIVFLLLVGGASAATLWPKEHAAVDKLPHSATATISARQRAMAIAHLGARTTLAPAETAKPDPLRASVRVHVIDTSRRGVARASVHAEHDGDVVTEAQSDERGFAILHLVVGEETRLSVRTDDGREGTLSEFWPTATDTDETIPENQVSIEVIEIATLTGRILDENGEGIAGASLALVPIAMGMHSERVAGAQQYFNELRAQSRPPALAVAEADLEEMLTTDALGEFSLPLREEGAWTLMASAEGRIPNQTGSIQLVSGQTNNVELRLERGHDFQGRVVDHEGKPVTNAMVSLVFAHVQLRQQVSETGTFRFAGFEETQADAQVYGEGFLGRELRITSAAPDTRIEMSRGALLDLDICAPRALGGEVGVAIQGGNSTATDR
ncbi:MAG: carboxypeptidase regulatory-like domain-containing protein [Sandaracinaceae bacterium]|nr:carboxypeptidase regulatory-like domain-containing protein [Sandaracinaceae bacterium]